tara:strand:+ start:436 stop:1653 length:1218 start_codon:yes stop_codon:yes gene_type:complete
MSSVEDKLPQGWVETTLGEVVSTNQDSINKNFKFEEIYYLDTGSITEGKIEGLQKYKLIEAPSRARRLVQNNDIVYSTVRPNQKHYGFIENPKENLVVSTGFAVISSNKKSFSKYIYYLLTQNSVTFFLHQLAEQSASAYPSIKPIDIENLKINIPLNVEEQKAIAKVLTAFDDKIENLRAQNNTLEQTAQTIFKEWFGIYQIGDELPEGWRVGTIGDLTEIKRGGSPRPIKDYISDSGYRWLKISDATATDSPYIFEIKEHIKIEGLKKTTLKKAGDLVLSNSATPGMPKFLAVDTCVHDGWMHFPSSIVSNEYLYLLFLHIRPTLVQQGSGSVFVNLKTDILRYYETVIPSNKALTDFDRLIKPIFDKILSNAKQIQTLTKTRDALLPKLMRGEIRVNGFKNN